MGPAGNCSTNRKATCRDIKVYFTLVIYYNVFERQIKKEPGLSRFLFYEL